MSVFSADEGSCAVIGAAKAGNFCQTSARSLDAYFAGRTRRAVPEVTLQASNTKSRAAAGLLISAWRRPSRPTLPAPVSPNRGPDHDQTCNAFGR